MSLVVSTNMSALNTINKLNKNSALMNSSLEKLSSGYSINSAADNAAGLSISEKMRAQIQGLDQASSNSQDATSLTQTADGALDETTTILKRMRELAVQGSSETLTDSDRESIQDEVDSLRQEIDRISNDTEYNTKKLLNGDSGSTTSVSGTNSSAIIASETSAGNNTASGTYTVEYTSVATQASIGSALNGNYTGISSQTSSATSFAGNISINGQTITVESGDTIEGVIKKINDETGTTGVTAALNTDNTGSYYIQLTDNTYGSSSSITLKADTKTLKGLFNAIDSASTATSVTTTGTNATGTINGAVASANGNTLTAFDLTVTGDDSSLATLGTAEASQASTAYSTLNSQAKTSSDATLKSAYTSYESALASSSDSTVATAKANYDTAVANLSATTTASTSASTTGAATAATDMTTTAAGDNLSIKIGSTTFTLDNTALTALGASATASDLVTAINNKIGSAGTASLDASNNLIITSADTGSTASVSVSATGTAIQALSGYTATPTDATGSDAIVKTSASDVAKAYSELTKAIANTTDSHVTAAEATYEHAAANSTDTTAVQDFADYQTATIAATTDVNVNATNALTFQVGANSNQTMTISLDDMDAAALGVAGSSTDTGIDLSSADKATAAISTIDSAISKVAAGRSNLGAVQNSLESNIDNLDTESENLSSAESNIRDTDMASEMSEYTKLSVITQAATAMLAKANQQPQQVLSLLQG